MFQDLELIELLVAPGPLRQDHAAALFKNRLYRRWGIKTAREYAQTASGASAGPGLHQRARARRRRRTLYDRRKHVRQVLAA